MSKVIVVGAGPAGMMAAIKASEKNEVTLIDRNEKIGKKLFITGKGRCNVTNAKDIGDFFDFIPGNPEFLYSALYTFTNQDAIDFFESLGVKLKIERGDRVFPESDKSSDIINAFGKALKKNNVKVLLNKKVTDIIIDNNSISYLEVNNEEKIYGDYFIFCTGGFSYPQTGSNGECHKLLEKMGHNITPINPSLVPVQIEEGWVKELQGLSLKNVNLKILRGTKVIYEEFGEMLFTHFGISGPIVLSASRYLNNINVGEDYKAVIDLKPALNPKELDERLQKDFAKYINKQFKNALDDLLPQKLISVIINLSNIDENKKVNVITRDERKSLVALLKNLTLSIKSLRPIAEAIVTSGGIDVREIDPSTMASKVVNNLYFAGELMDVDAFTGGYNVQIAMSTGYLAGLKVGEK